MNETGVSVDEACEMRALTDADYARLCTQEGNDIVLYIFTGALVMFVALTIFILMSRRK